LAKSLREPLGGTHIRKVRRAKAALGVLLVEAYRRNAREAR
jgi:hypothetical protein